MGEYKKELNEYCAAINSVVGTSELTTHQIIGYLLKLSSLSSGKQITKLSILNPGALNAEKMRRAEAFAEKVQARLNDIGTLCELLFWAIGLKVLLPPEQEKLQTALNEGLTSVELLNNESARIAHEMGFKLPELRKESIELDKAALLTAGAPNLEGINIESGAFITRKKEIEELINTGLRLSQIHAEYDKIFIPEAWVDLITVLLKLFTIKTSSDFL